MSAEAKAKWVTPFTKGSMKANTNEEWTYDHGVVKCVFGPLGGQVFTWDGCDLVSDIASAAFDSDTTVHIVHAGQKKAFVSMTKTVAGDLITWTCTQIAFRSPSLQWTHDVKARALAVVPNTAIDHPEGVTTNWTCLGEIPPPVAIIIAMLTRVTRLNELLIEFNSRSFKRCAILTITTVEAYLCAACAAGDGATTCACCKNVGATHKSTLCKQCAVKGKFRCVKCDQPVGPLRVAALLCDTHGLGARAKECCKMQYRELR
jgi:hypothetical protein